MSGVLKIELKLDASGPLIDGGAQEMVDTWVDNTSGALAAAGVEMLRSWPMDRSKRATGAFQDHLEPVRKSPGQMMVRGPQIKGETWAPWLEGTSQRNQGGKFKGYHLFRKTRLALSKVAPQIGQAELDKLMAGIGGE